MVAITLGLWPFPTPLLEMDPTGDDWVLACHALETAARLRFPPSEEV